MAPRRHYRDLSGAWEPLSVEWTPTSTVTSYVYLGIRKDAVGAVEVYLDNVRIWDTVSPDRNIPTETVYDADGRVIASVLPPGDLRTERSMTTVAPATIQLGG